MFDNVYILQILCSIYKMINIKKEHDICHIVICKYSFLVLQHFLTKGWITLFGAIISQNNGFVNKWLYQRVKVLIVHIHGSTIPIYNTTKLIEQPAKLDTNAPTILVFTFFANLLWTTTLANRKNQLKKIKGRSSCQSCDIALECRSNSTSEGLLCGWLDVNMKNYMQLSRLGRLIIL